MKPELEEVLQHHGIKGMHWGKHKKKEESHEVTKAKEEVAKRQANFKSVSRIGSQKSAVQIRSAARELGYAREDLKSAKILNKINSKPKSAYQLKMEEKYKKQGMSNDEATVAAYKNIRFKKIAAAAAILTVAAVGTYAGVKVRNEHFDKVIKSGTSLQNITSESNHGIRDAFYSAKNGLDKSKYKGLYGGHIKANQGKAFVKEVKVLTDIKQASPKNAHKILEDLVKNDQDFARAFKIHVSPNTVSHRLPEKYYKMMLKNEGAFKNGEVTKDIYEVFNASLADHAPGMQGLTDKYFKTLSDKGYNAIKDVNDSKYSGYKSLNPIIAFNSKGKVGVVDVKELAQKEIDKHSKIAWAHINSSDVAKKGALLAASLTGTMAAGTYANNKNNTNRVAKYRNANPNTKLTNTQIARMLERGA